MMNEDLMRMHGADEDRDYRRAALWSWIQPRLVPGRAIDVGGGSGYMTRRLLAAGYPTMLAEPDAELSSFSEETLPEGAELTLLRLPAEGLDPQEIGTFENVLCLDVLEHIDDDLAALRKIVPLLAPHGQAIITVPALPGLYGKRDVAYGHFRRHTTCTFRRLLEEGGLQVRELRYWNLLGVGPYFLFEKVLRRPIDDSLRQRPGNAAHRAVRTGLQSWLTFESSLPLPLGLSLLAVAQRGPAGS